MSTSALQTLIQQGADLTAIAGHLEALDSAERLRQCRALGRAAQRQLFALAQVHVTLDELAPPSTAPLTEIRQYGQNTLPLPAPWQRFEKRVCRPADGSPRLFGYNEGSTRPLIGPGYFVAYSTADHPQWRERGGVVVDYAQVPDGAVVPGWPKVVPNSQGLQMFVFKGTSDFIRKISEHVSIGAAYKSDKPLDHYFMLVRE